MKLIKLFAIIILSSLAFACEDAAAPEAPPDAEFGLESLDSKGDFNVIREGSIEADAILSFCNQPLENSAEGKAFQKHIDTKLHATAARNIAKYRAGKDGAFGTSDDQKFDTLKSLDALPYVGPAALRALLELAEADGYLVDTALPDLREALHEAHAGHMILDYREAREHMFATLDNRNGVVEDIYAGKLVRTSGIPDHTVMNCEHTWPQSLLKNAGAGAAISDLHHLFPVDSQANSRRSSYPFGTVTGATWTEGGSMLGRPDYGGIVFEVRPTQRGNTARAMFYISVMYNLEISAREEATLRAWNTEDPVDALELRRNDAIEALQGNRNPFVDDASLVSQIADF